MTMNMKHKEETGNGYGLLKLGGYNALRERFWKGSPWSAFRELARR